MRGCRSTWWRSTSAGSGPSRRACSRCSGEPGPYPTDLIDNARIYYRDYLRGLTRTDAQRRAQYGELATRVERELTEEGPDPQEVADAVGALIATRRSAAAANARRRADLPSRAGAPCRPGGRPGRRRSWCASTRPLPN